MAHEGFKNLELDGKLFEDWDEKDRQAWLDFYSWEMGTGYKMSNTRFNQVYPLVQKILNWYR